MLKCGGVWCHMCAGRKCLFARAILILHQKALKGVILILKSLSAIQDLNMGLLYMITIRFDGPTPFHHTGCDLSFGLAYFGIVDVFIK